jgi:adenylyltransferase/sulfurtransferase
VTLSQKEKERYNRQMIFDNWGGRAQEKIKNATVFIAGAGGLGSPVALYLAAGGVGTLSICDFEKVKLSNLNRQILHSEERIGQNKAASAQETLRTVNPDIRVHPIAQKITDTNTEEIIGAVDLIVDCLDNFETRHILNRYAVRNSIPMIHAGVYGMHGQISFINAPRTPCLWCVYSGSPPPQMFPIVGATACVIGGMQALEALKYLSGIGTLLENCVLFWDGMTMEFHRFEPEKNPRCRVCAG